MFKIGEFAQIGQVSTHMLRNYDRLGLLNPSTIDRFTSYRYYTLDQLARLNRIVALRKLGLSLDQIGDLLTDDLSAEQLKTLLDLRKASIEKEMLEMQMQLTAVEARLDQIRNEGQDIPYEIVIKPMPSWTMARVRGNPPHMSVVGAYCNKMHAHLNMLCDAAGIVRKPPLVNFYHLPEYREHDIDMSYAIAVDPKSIPEQLPEGLSIITTDESAIVAAMLYEDSLKRASSAVLAAQKWVAQNGYIAVPPAMEIHHAGVLEGHRGDSGEPIVEFLFTIQKIGA